MPNLDDILGPPSGGASGGNLNSTIGPPSAAPAGGNLDDILGPPSGSGGNLDSILGTAGGKAASAAKKSGGGGILGHVTNVLKQAGNFLNPVNQAEGLYHLGQEGVGEAVAPVVAGARLAGINPNLFGIKGNAAADALLGNAQGQKGLSVFAQEAPAITGAAVHLGKTVAGAVQLPYSAEQAAQHLSLAPLQNSILGQRVRQEGVLPSILSTAGDALMIAGGAGAGLDAAGAGDAAQATKLENLANSVKGSPEEGYANSAHADQMAQDSAASGDATQAAEHAQAAQNLSQAEQLRANVAQQGPVGRGLNQVRQGLDTVEHLGNQVAGAPVELLSKGVPKLASYIPGVTDAANAAREAVGNSGFVQGLKEKGAIRNVAQEGAAERARLAQPVKVAFNEAAKLTPELDDQLATQLVRRGDVNALTAPQLDAMSDAQLQDHIDRTGIHATPAALRTAIDYTQNPDAHPEITQAKQLLDSVQAPADLRFVTGRGSSQILGDGALAERQAKVAGEPSQAGIAKRRAAIQKLIDFHQGALDQAMQQGLSEREAPLTEAQGRNQAARNARATVTERLGSDRQGINARASADEVNASQQSLANRRSLADAEREIAARSQRIQDLQARQAAVPGSDLKVQAPQVRTAVQSAAETRSSLLQAAQDAHASGDVAEGQRLAGLAGKAAPTAAELKAAGVAPTFLPGSEVPEKPVAGTGSRPRVASVKKLASERMRTGIAGPMDFESQQALYENNIAGQVRNEVNRRLLTDVASPASAHVEDASLTGQDLVDALAEKDRVPVGIVHKNGVDTVDALDPSRNPNEKVTADTPTISAKAWKEYKKTFTPGEQGPVMKAIRSVENVGRVTKLLGPGFVLHKGITDLILDKIAGGVGPVELAKHIPEAYRQTKEGTLPANIGAIEKPSTENMSAVDRAVGKVAEKGMVGFRTLDSTNRGALYGALRDQGLSPMQAEARTQAVAGNIRDINQQVGGLRHVITYPGWQLHLAKILASIPVEHLSGMLQSGAVAAAVNRSYAQAHPNQKPTTGGLDDAVNPFGSLLGLGKGIPGESALQNATNRAGSMIAPVPEFFGNLAGVDLRHGKTVQVPGPAFGQTPTAEQRLGGPADLNVPRMFLHTFVPQISQIQDAAGQANAPGGFIPYRYTTDQPETNSSGTVQVKPGTTKLGAIANLIGIPHATPVQAKKKKK